MAFYLAQAFGLLNSAFPWSMNSILSSASNEAAVAASFNTAFIAFWTQAALTTYIPTTVNMTGTSVSTASAQFKQTTKTTTLSTHAGTSASIALPYHTCANITFRTASATKYGRGRWFVPTLATNALAATGFTILAATQTALQSAMNAYAASHGATYSHVILHRKATAGGARGAFSTDPVTGCDIPSIFSVQRRRADKVVPTRITASV